MSKEPNLATLQIYLGILLTIIPPSLCVWTINSAYGKVSNNVKNVNFEIFKCPVQGNCPHEMSGPSPEVGGESPAANVDKSPETKTRDEESRDEKSRDKESRDKESRDEESRDEESRDEESRDEESRDEESRDEDFFFFFFFFFFKKI